MLNVIYIGIYFRNGRICTKDVWSRDVLSWNVEMSDISPFCWTFIGMKMQDLAFMGSFLNGFRVSYIDIYFRNGRICTKDVRSWDVRSRDVHSRYIRIGNVRQYGHWPIREDVKKNIYFPICPVLSLTPSLIQLTKTTQSFFQLKKKHSLFFVCFTEKVAKN